MVCRGCKTEKPPDMFSPNKRMSSGRQPSCKACCAEAARQFRKAHPGRKPRPRTTQYDGATQADRRLRKLYGWSLADKAKAFAIQKGCAICERVFEIDTTHIDHCHETGRVRQVLCQRCNQGLGLFQDDPERLRRAAAYIKMWQAIHYLASEADRETGQV